MYAYTPSHTEYIENLMVITTGEEIDSGGEKQRRPLYFIYLSCLNLLQQQEHKKHQAEHVP